MAQPVEVKRDNIFHDILMIYKKRTTVSCKVAITFYQKQAFGDGVSAFFKTWYKEMDGEHEKVPSKTNMDDDDLEISGKIITHAFIQFGIFPVKLCKCSMKSLIGKCE